MADYVRRDIVLEIINTVNDTGGFAGYADYCVLFDEIDFFVEFLRKKITEVNK